MIYVFERPFFSLSRSFKIRDGAGGLAFEVLSELFSFGHRLTLRRPGGTTAAEVHQRLFSSRSAYEIARPGRPAAEIRRVSWVGPGFEIDAGPDGRIAIGRNLWATRYRFVTDGAEIAVARTPLFSLGRVRRVEVLDGVDPILPLAGLAAILTIRADQSRRDGGGDWRRAPSAERPLDAAPPLRASVSRPASAQPTRGAEGPLKFRAAAGRRRARSARVGGWGAVRARLLAIDPHPEPRSQRRIAVDRTGRPKRGEPQGPQIRDLASAIEGSSEQTGAPATSRIGSAFGKRGCPTSIGARRRRSGPGASCGVSAGCLSALRPRSCDRQTSRSRPQG